MFIARRQFLLLAASAIAFPATSAAQDYPTRPVHLIVPFPAGGQIDPIARIMGQWLSERLGQPFIIENRPGGATNIGTEAVIRAPADGYTLLLASGPNTVNASLIERLGFDFIRDTTAVAGINRIPLVMQAHPAFPARSIAALIAHAKANPGKITLATGPKGTVPYMAAELFQMLAGINIVHVPYRGDSAMLTDLVGGQVQVAINGVSSSVEMIRAGRLVALGVASASRLEALVEVPPIADTIAGFEASGFCGIVAPKHTPVEITERLNREINAGLADPTLKARLKDVGVTVLAGSRAEFAQFLVRETEKWANVIKLAGIKAD
jgi:tripartite-type tricarboxylate transporter receptor subunit TctC